jgi:hypothetical protein
MSRRRPPFIELRRPVYIGCEGASEVGYVGFLQDLIRNANLPVHLHVDELGPGTGDPLSRIEMAVLRLKQLERKRSGSHCSIPTRPNAIPSVLNARAGSQPTMTFPSSGNVHVSRRCCCATWKEGPGIVRPIPRERSGRWKGNGPGIPKAQSAPILLSASIMPQS